MWRYVTHSPRRNLATRCCLRRLARASISSTITSTAAAYSRPWLRNWRPKPDGAETQNGLDSIHHHCPYGVLRRGDAVQRVIRDGATEIRLILALLRAPARMDGGGDQRDDAHEAQTLSHAAESYGCICGCGDRADAVTD